MFYVKCLAPLRPPISAAPEVLTSISRGTGLAASSASRHGRGLCPVGTVAVGLPLLIVLLRLSTALNNIMVVPANTLLVLSLAPLMSLSTLPLWFLSSPVLDPIRLFIASFVLRRLSLNSSRSICKAVTMKELKRTFVSYILRLFILPLTVPHPTSPITSLRWLRAIPCAPLLPVDIISVYSLDAPLTRFTSLLSLLPITLSIANGFLLRILPRHTSVWTFFLVQALALSAPLNIRCVLLLSSNGRTVGQILI